MRLETSDQARRLTAALLVWLLALSPAGLAQDEHPRRELPPVGETIASMLDTESLVHSRLARRALVARGETARLALTARWPEEARWWARWEILDALREIGSPASEPIFVQALSDPSYAVRAVSVRALDRLRSPLLWERAAALADDDAWTVRRALAVACGRHRGTSTAEVLARLAQDEDEDVRRAALRALDRRHDARAASVIRQLLQLADSREEVFEWITPAGRPELAASFAEALPLVEDDGAAITTAAMLSRCQADPPYSDAQRAAIRDRLLLGLAQSELVQSRAAAEALRHWGPELAPRLRDLLDTTTDAAAHRQIWDLLIDLEGEGLVPFLRDRLRNGIANRSLAIRALGRLADRSLLPFFLELWTDEAEPATHQAILSAIQRFEASEALPLLEKALTAESFRTRHQAAAILVDSKPPGSVEPLLEHIETETDRQQTQYLRLVTSWAHPAIEAWLLEMAESSDSLALRRAAIEALGTYVLPSGDSAIVARLRSLLDELVPASGSAEERSADRRTRVILVRSLANRLGSDCAGLLKRLHEIGADEQDDELLRAVVGSTAGLSAPDRRELLQQTLGDPRLESFPVLLRDTARRLAREGDPSAGEFMRRHFESAQPDERVLILPELADFEDTELEREVLALLERAVQQSDLDYVLLQALIEYALGKRSAPLLPPLLQLAENEAAPLALRTGALEAIADIGPTEGAEEGLLALARREVESARGSERGSWTEERKILLRRLFDALGRVGTDRSVPLLADSLFLASLLELEEEVWAYYQQGDRSLPDSRFAWEATIVRALARHRPELVDRELLRVIDRLRRSATLSQINDDKLAFVGRALLLTGRSRQGELGAELLETCFHTSPSPSPADFEAHYWLANRAWGARDYSSVAAHLESAIDALWSEVLSPSEARVRIDLRVALLSPRETLEAWRRLARVLEAPEHAERRESFARTLREVVAPDAELLLDLSAMLLSHEGPRALVDLALRLASEADPQRSDLARLRARRAAEDEAWEMAAAELALAADRAARDGLCELATLHLERARCLVAAGRSEEARESLRKAFAEEAGLRRAVAQDPRLAPLLEGASSSDDDDR